MIKKPEHVVFLLSPQYDMRDYRGIIGDIIGSYLKDIGKSEALININCGANGYCAALKTNPDPIGLTDDEVVNLWELLGPTSFVDIKYPAQKL